MIVDFAGKQINVGDMLAFATTSGRTASLEMRKVVALKDKKGNPALMVVSVSKYDGKESGTPRAIRFPSRTVVLNFE